MLKKIGYMLLENLAEENKVVVLLKGYNTIITDGECVYINKSGNSKGFWLVWGIV